MGGSGPGGGCQAFETPQRAPRGPYLGPWLFLGRKREAQRGKAFSCGFCVWFALNEAGRVFVVCFPTFQRQDDGWPSGGGRPHAMPLSRTLTPGGCAPCAAAPGPAERRAKSERGPRAPRAAPVERRRARLCRAVNSFTPGPGSQWPCLDRKMCVIGFKEQAGGSSRLEPCPPSHPHPGGTQAAGGGGVCGTAGGRGDRKGRSDPRVGNVEGDWAPAGPLCFSWGVGLGASVGAGSQSEGRA